MSRFPLDLPFLPDEGYLGFLASLAPETELACLHFSLHSPAGADARIPSLHQGEHLDPSDLAGLLARVPGPDKHALLNSRFHSPGELLDKKRIRELARSLAVLADADQVRGVVFADPFLLAALARTEPGLPARLEAVPSVNCMLDTPDKLLAMLELTDSLGWRAPSKIVPDRSLNRDLDGLERLVRTVRRNLPETWVVLLANEGCLYQCPYKPAHDAMAAQVHETGPGARSDCSPFAVIRELGCARRLAEAPWRLFRSPFIRPEDMVAYEGLCDVIKVCGRTRGPDFLAAAARSYLDERHQGNLLDLMDTLEWMIPIWEVDNRALPGDYLSRLVNCSGDCAACGWCEKLFEETARPGPNPFSDSPGTISDTGDGHG